MHLHLNATGVLKCYWTLEHVSSSRESFTLILLETKAVFVSLFLMAQYSTVSLDTNKESLLTKLWSIKSFDFQWIFIQFTMLKISVVYCFWRDATYNITSGPAQFLSIEVVMQILGDKRLKIIHGLLYFLWIFVPIKAIFWEVFQIPAMG